MSNMSNKGNKNTRIKYLTIPKILLEGYNGTLDSLETLDNEGIKNIVGKDDVLVVSYELKRGTFKLFIDEEEVSTFKDENYTKYIFKYILNNIIFRSTDDIFDIILRDHWELGLGFSSHNSFSISFDALDNKYMFCLIRIRSTYESSIEEQIITKESIMRTALIKGLIMVLNGMEKV